MATDWDSFKNLSSDLKAEVDNAQLAIWEMAARTDDLIYYQTPDYTFVEDASYDANWSFFDQKPRDSYTGVVESGSLQARVTYKRNPEYNSHIGGTADMNIKGYQDLGEIKIAVRETGYNILKDTEEFYWCGDKYEKNSDWRKLGILGDFHVYTLEIRRAN